MCGFVVAVNAPAQQMDRKLSAAARLLAHRGPDDEAFFVSPRFAAGFRRLSIIDLSNDARQPMADDSGRYRIVFNGEIYNYRELRRELEQHGWKFRTRSDTEVLLTAYRAWGEDCLPRLNGMFAFLIWDATEERLFGARDRFGEKPLFYAEDGGAVYLASEIKALFPLLGRPAEPHLGAMRRYVVDKWSDHSAQTFYRGIFSVPAAHAVTVRGGRVATRRYWRLEAARVAVDRDVVGQFRELFLDAVRLRMRADVPVGTCLSGGLDSGSIVCSIPRVLREAGTRYSGKSFTAAYAEYDESGFVAEVNRAGGATGHQCVPTPAGLNAIEDMLWYHDEPFHSFAAFASFEVMRLARQQGVVVLLNGQGADETLAGYSKYLSAYLLDLLLQGKLCAAWDAARGGRSLTGRGSGELLRQAAWAGVKQRLRAAKWWGKGPRTDVGAAERCGFTREFATASGLQDAPPWHEPGTGASPLHAALLQSIRVNHLPLYLRVEDRNSMAHSLESRLPFLDHRLVEFVFSVPTYWLMQHGRNKYLLREAMKGILPESVRQRGDKYGFPIPEVRWLYGDLRPEVEALLSSRLFVERGQFDAPALLEQYRREAELWRSGQADLWERRSRWFRIVSLELWQRGLTRYSATAADGRQTHERPAPGAVSGVAW